jgi:hypothetical protein
MPSSWMVDGFDFGFSLHWFQMPPKWTPSTSVFSTIDFKRWRGNMRTEGRFRIFRHLSFASVFALYCTVHTVNVLYYYYCSQPVQSPIGISSTGRTLLITTS